MASKFQVIPGGIDSSANDPKSDAKAEMKGESLLSKFEIDFIKELRQKIANIPNIDEDDCLDALIRFEGSENVSSKYVERALFTRDRRGLFSAEEKTKDGFVPIRPYLQRLFKNRIESITKEPQAIWDKIYP